jgi:hypothetical protein
MIYNTVVCGTVDTVTSVVKLKYMSHDLETVLEKEYANTEGAYEFHLGDEDMLTMNGWHSDGDVVVVQNWVAGALVYSDKIELSEYVYMYRHDIAGNVVASLDEVSSVDESKNLLGKALIYEEDNLDIYSYYKVEFDGAIVYETNEARMRYVPEVDGEYTITHRGVNRTTGAISEVVYVVNVLEGVNETLSIDMVYYAKKDKVLKIELPEYVTRSLMLEPGWYYEGGLLLGKKLGYADTVMHYYNGKVVVKTQIGDIVDY